MHATSASPELPLKGILVLDFSQFLAGPSAALRLADLGADVIKIERPNGGDLSRQLYVSNLSIDGDSAIFHAINRNKRSFAANLKHAEDLASVRQLIRQADVMIQNFRPGIIERLGLGYDAVSALNPRIVYGSVTGYGDQGPWRDKPGQDLLVQALSGLACLNGNADDPPIAVGVAVADMMTGAHLVQGILAALLRRTHCGCGGKVDVSLMESTLDLQFEFLTTYLNGGGLPQRSRISSASGYLSAPYGIYPTRDGFIAIAMTPVDHLGRLIACQALTRFTSTDAWFCARDDIKTLLHQHLRTQTTAHWLSILEAADVWCATVQDWPALMAHPGFQALEMTQHITNPRGVTLTTTRCPIRIDGHTLTCTIGAPRVGEHTQDIRQQYLHQEDTP